MQINSSTGEVYAGCESTHTGETIELMTLGGKVEDLKYGVVVWDDIGEMRWCMEFTRLDIAVAEYNRWAKVPEKVPTFN